MAPPLVPSEGLDSTATFVMPLLPFEAKKRASRRLFPRKLYFVIGGLRRRKGPALAQRFEEGGLIADMEHAADAKVRERAVGEPDLHGRVAVDVGDEVAEPALLEDERAFGPARGVLERLGLGDDDAAGRAEPRLLSRRELCFARVRQRDIHGAREQRHGDVLAMTLDFETRAD